MVNVFLAIVAAYFTFLIVTKSFSESFLLLISYSYLKERTDIRSFAYKVTLKTPPSFFLDKQMSYFVL